MSGIFVYITLGSMEEARKIGRTLIEERLAGCVNIFPQMFSLYRWQEDVCEDTEVVMIVKTQSVLFEQVAARVRKLHSYTNPAILEIPLGRVAQEYYTWLLDETSPIQPSKKS